MTNKLLNAIVTSPTIDRVLGILAGAAILLFVIYYFFIRKEEE